MCLLAVLFHTHPEAPVVIAANRDERYTRPAEPIQVLRPAAPRILGGRDVLAGGTWLAVNEHGVYAGVTNRPSVGGRDPSRRSRGQLPLMCAGFARADEAMAALQEKIHCSDYNPCWLLVGDREALFYLVIGRQEKPEVSRLLPGIHVLENRPLDAVSAKVNGIHRALRPAAEWMGVRLLNELYRVLRSHDLPEFNVSEDPEENGGLTPPQVRAACVHTPDYGTRSAALIIVPPAPTHSPLIHYADGPPCTAPLIDASHLWTTRP